ncbi:YqjF family protein [Streptomonospora nanhaiensis]|uniref:DUF2071 domain-containing protein n=1 Tax=Streptomonospora nanhaiensis TaxID=1323731 RepID=A0A853BW47_9ACTN|nr:DUF2071 domain-containing protein [Streptomonospora nanhaiensis]MBV2365390.1 DUF2071 domain-containing protein [Streptomonospora nanhaiensis]MBX9390718.1 DUF2071 domain-containing protein [Streptomonospora nanhaiensis]NYI99016.1 hypothetical protein [Streptomonospora nanhaiensis]
MSASDPLPPEAVAPPPGPPALTQGWRDVVFLHWSVDPDLVAPLLPPGTRPDVLAGSTYVGVVAFGVAYTRVLGAVPTGGFDEANVRLYARDRNGRQGVVFLTMDADSAHNVLAGRALARVPYIWSDVAVRTAGGQAVGGVRRRAPGPPARARWRVAVGAPIARPSPLERFVTARWGLFTTWFGATAWIPVAHPPWPLHSAWVLRYEGDLVAAAGVALPDRPPESALWSPGVATGFYLPRR